jgi:hypothetical protein
MSDIDYLFNTFEQRVPTCSACCVDVENIDALAAYFGSGYEVTVVRSPGHLSLSITHEGKTITVLPGQMLLYGHPPTVMSRDEFSKEWRHERAEERLCKRRAEARDG